jgi:hypothetical protein
MENYIEELYDFYYVPQNHRLDPSLSESCCPNCKTVGRWRSGAEFDSMRICSKCWSVWTPGMIRDYRELVAKELNNVGGDGV